MRLYNFLGKDTHALFSPSQVQLHATHRHRVFKMQNFRQGKKVFDVNLSLEAQPITRASMAKQLLAIPLMSFKVTAGIYWQALKIGLKGVPFLGHAHEKTNNKET